MAASWHSNTGSRYTLDRILIKDLSDTLSSLRSDVNDAISSLEEHPDFEGKADVIKLIDNAYYDINDALDIISRVTEED